jgi:hypothetical protein
MQAWRQRPLGGRTSENRTHLTPTGLLMEGDFTRLRFCSPLLRSIECNRIFATVEPLRIRLSVYAVLAVKRSQWYTVRQKGFARSKLAGWN